MKLYEYVNGSVNRSSTPGWPWCDLVNDNATLFREHGRTIIDAVCARLELLAAIPNEQLLTLSPQDLVVNGYVDLCRIIVKGEPHSARKRREKRARLIFLVSIVDQLIERLLCQTQNKTENLNWTSIPSKNGLGFSDQANDYLYSAVSSLNGGVVDAKCAEADITGFDMSYQEWEHVDDCRIRCALNGSAKDSLYARILHNRSTCLSRGPLCTPKGRCFYPTKPGIQKSGSYNTGNTNSKVRAMIAYHVGADWIISNGDDAVEQYVEGAAELYLDLGHPLKNYDPCPSGSFGMNSHLYMVKGSHPDNPDKSFYTLLQHENLDNALVSGFLTNMRHHPERDKYAGYISGITGREY